MRITSKHVNICQVVTIQTDLIQTYPALAEEILRCIPEQVTTGRCEGHHRDFITLNGTSKAITTLGTRALQRAKFRDGKNLW